MQPTVYVVGNSTKINKELFESDKEASNYAKTRSEWNTTICSIYVSPNRKLFFYENGSLANQRRTSELNSITQEIIYEAMRREAKQGVKTRH